VRHALVRARCGDTVVLTRGPSTQRCAAGTRKRSKGHLYLGDLLPGPGSRSTTAAGSLSRETEGDGRPDHRPAWAGVLVGTSLATPRRRILTNRPSVARGPWYAFVQLGRARMRWIT
jgi:hypothetical protein